MKNTFKRIAVIALAVLMCVSAAMPAFAAGNACPGEGKTHTAYNCTYQEVSKQEATCETAGAVTGKCTTCGTIFSVSQTAALGHDWDVTTQAVCGYASTKTCKRCETVETVGAVLEHLFTAWTLAEGECGVPGARITRECVWCKEVEADKLGKEGHVYALVSYVEPAKCIDKGVATYECTVAGCDAVKEVAITSDNATHDYRAWTTADGKDVNAKKATCDAKGRASMICDDCKKVVVVATDKDVCDVDVVDAKAATCTVAGNIKYWHCPDCDAYYSDEALTTVITKADTVIPAIHDGLTTSADAIDYEYLPTCDTDGLVIYTCKVDGCDKAGELTLPKYTKHVYYNDVKTVAEKAAIIDALNNTKDFTKGWSDAKVEAEWVKLGKVDVNAYGKDKVWTGYTPADCEKNATVTYKCLNFTYSYETGAYVFATCNVATETVLTGEGYEKVGHKFADNYPLSYSQKGDLKATAAVETDAVLAGTQAYKWDGLEASCKTVGRRINYCINEYQLPDGTYTSCPKTETVGVPALGHDYVALTLADLDKDDDETEYTVKTEVKTEAELYEIVKADVVTCVEDGKAYTVCTRCNDVQATNVTSAGTEHNWMYMDSKGNPAGTVYDGNAVDVEGEGTLAEVYGNASCTDEVKGYYRQCQNEGCKAALTMEPITVPARGHSYVDTNDKAVLEALLAITTEGGVDAKGNKLVKKGSCENGAIFSLKCENCAIPKSFEIKEGFGGGHVKTYIPNTAVAATCTVDGASNKWYCANETCDYYGYINNDGDLVLKAGMTVAKLKSDVVTGNTHEIWNAKKEAYEAVDWKDVPDTKISGVDEADAKKVEAPVVDGKVVRYVAIEGTSYVWVYKFTSEDHRVASVAEGFLFCVDCGNYNVFAPAGHSNTTVEQEATCEQVGFTYTYCTKCFEGTISDFEPAVEHTYHFVTEADGVFTVDTDKWFGKGTAGESGYIPALKGTDEAKTEGLNYVAPTCTNAGYAIDNCKTCDKIVTVGIKAHGHINKNGQVLESSCLDVVFPRDCAICGTKNIPYGHDWDENAICKVCNAAK